MPPPPAAPSRRAVLATALVAGGGALSGCDGGGSHPAARRPAPPDPRRLLEDSLRAAALADERALVAAYHVTGLRHPSVAAVLAVPLAHHALHLKALGAPAAEASAAPGGAAAGSTSAASPSAAPADPLLALRSLAALERATARRRRTACATASGELAGLLGSLGACEAAHADLLGGS